MVDEPTITAAAIKLPPDIRARSEVARKAIRDCIAQNPQIDQLGMVKCSRYLVNSNTLAACLHKSTSHFCLPPRVCEPSEKPALGVCVPAPNETAVTWTSPQWRKLLAYQRVEHEVPANIFADQATQNRYKACKPGPNYDRCIAEASLQPEDRQLAECIKKTQADPVQVAATCFKLKLPPKELAFAQCAFAKESSAAVTRDCDSKDVTDIKRATLIECRSARTLVELGGCLAFAGQPPERVKQAMCLYKLGGLSEVPHEKVIECFPPGMLDEKTATEVRNAVLATKVCLASAGDQESLLRCAPGGPELASKYKTQLDCVKAKGTKPFDDGLLDCVEGNDEIRTVRKCFAANSADLGALAAHCAGRSVPQSTADIALCAGRIWQADTERVDDVWSGCEKSLGQHSQLYAKIGGCKAAYDKGKGSKNETVARADFLTCTFNLGGLDTATRCLIQKHSTSALEYVADCGPLIKISGLKSILLAGDCYAKSKSAAAFAVCIGGGKIDTRVAGYVACLQDPKLSSGAKLACIAAQHMKKEHRDFVECGTKFASSYAAGATCAAQKLLNIPGIKHQDEVTMVAECAAVAVDAWSAAGCVALQLTFKELAKCSKGVGREGGCYGPNNELVKLVKFVWQAQASIWVPGTEAIFIAPRVIGRVIDVFFPGNPVSDSLKYSKDKVKRWWKRTF